VISVIPIFVTLIFFGDGDTAADSFPHVIAVGILLALVAFGAYLIVRACMIWGGYQILLEEGDFSRTTKVENKRNEALSSIYWCAVTAGYLAWSFISKSWDKTWIVWPIAGVVFGLVLAVANAARKH
jgi:hypothetical protein